MAPDLPEERLEKKLSAKAFLSETPTSSPERPLIRSPPGRVITRPVREAMRPAG